MRNDLSLDTPLAIIGEEDIVLGFKALGFMVYPLKDLEEAKLRLAEIVKANKGACLIQDDIYEKLKIEIDSYKREPLPIFIPFSKTAGTKILDGIIKNIRLRATGTV